MWAPWALCQGDERALFRHAPSVGTQLTLGDASGVKHRRCRLSPAHEGPQGTVLLNATVLYSCYACGHNQCCKYMQVYAKT